jgi:outer membrane protein assembly factor BamB
VGGAGQALVAFDRKTGKVAWKNHSFDLSPSSPTLIHVDGQEQLLLFHSKGVAGLDPKGGAVYWDQPHRTQYGLNISTPVWGPDNLLFISSAYDGGSRALRLHQREGKTTVEEVWYSNRMRVHFGNAARIGDAVYGSNGDFGPVPFTAVEAASGKVLWQDRDLGRCSFVVADGKLVALDEEGGLVLATVDPKALHVLARARVFDGRAWTAPTLSGTRLFVRDRATIKAFELGQAG